MLWEMFCWETLGPAIHVDVNLTRATYLNIVADQGGQEMKMLDREREDRRRERGIEFNKGEEDERGLNDGEGEDCGIIQQTGSPLGCPHHQRSPPPELN
ncbi:hypothetical protein MATL_G00155170 [Megalops atlanticus]|uniref:Uncharacterized protein n=1 Tax=Megalops atlanticus TaxID=7932 RepID=A0A9D3T5J4_MEGAT|nr:hypothetical protein MATL_G00155170 [Megalops atlanticus]